MNQRRLKEHYTNIGENNAESKNEKNEVDAERLADRDGITCKAPKIGQNCHMDKIDAVTHPG